MLTVLIVLQVIAALLLIGLVLMQNSKGAEAGAAFGGTSQSVFGSQGSANFLTRMTALLATVFMVSSLALASLSARQNQQAPDFFSAPETQNQVLSTDSDADVPAPVSESVTGDDVPVTEENQVSAPIQPEQAP